MKTHDEIFANLKADKVKGLMYHEQLRNAFNLLNLNGFERWQEYRFICENLEMIKLNTYYIEKHGMLVDEMPISNPEIIPSSWYRVDRSKIDISTKQKAVRDLFNEWCEWEKKVMSNLESYFSDLTKLGYVSDADFVDDMIKDHIKEMKHIERMKIELKSIDYNMVYISTLQHELHKKYKEKMECLEIEFE